jgi:MoaE-MoaD fusion protein
MIRRMRINVKLFAILRERAGRDQLDVELECGADARAALAQVARSCPAIAELLPKIAVAVNLEYVAPNRVLQDGDELALIPPVSGG